ncbi:hypothetical protein [Metapseudomonas furukawaii]|uniref:RelB/StbD replicon stabilization protein n=1 Tax=Metapseudomonas furukawaii TaxID=1149133 RepID=A0AAD1FIG2_METFU|nr:hypothetical protein [Pseudomonas furukawaii]ELS29339.1 RelB/StbD replicon stabilization protein (antitoxin to RelE/StbE) [Pseudomonas furukawaii]BAU76528.1 RelB/StbD replicon stabilization protein [Pseudomonas furukawaii]
MAFPVLADLAISLTDFKRDPIGAVRKGQGETVLVLDDDQPAFYAVPPAQYLALLERIDDLQLSELVRHRQGEPVVAVDIDDLIKEAAETSG